jgi:alpha-tubulin suppressor-like RCC1 family protein
VGLLAVMSLVTSLAGAFARPADAAPVLTSDTMRSGAGWAFGKNDLGQVTPTAPSASGQLTPKKLPGGGGGDLADAVSIAVGKGFTIWVDKLGRVWSIGDNGSGQKGNGSTGGTYTVPTLANGFGGTVKAVKVTAFGQGVNVLDSTGGVWQWGQVVNNNSQLATSNTPTKLEFPKGGTPQATIIDVVAGDAFSIAIDSTGKAWSWGKNDVSQLGNGLNSNSPYPALMPTGTGKLPATLPTGAQVNIAAGRDFGVYTVSYTSNATQKVDVYTWGRNDLYQLGNNSKLTGKTPALAVSLNAGKVLEVSAGTSHSLLLTNDGIVRTWGANGLTPTAQVPTQVTSGLISGLNHPYTVEAGDNVSLIANTDGSLVGWGVDPTGALGRGSTGTVTSPSVMAVPGTIPGSLTGIPAQFSSRNGTTAVIVNAEIASASAVTPFPPYPVNPQPSQTATSQTVTIRNIANKPLQLSQALYTDGANPNDFVLSNSTCTPASFPAPGYMAIDATCQVTVTFKPTAAGSRQASLVLRTANMRGGVPLSYFVPLSGTGYSAVNGLSGYKLDYASGTPAQITGRGNRLPLSQLSPELIPERIVTAGSTATGKIATGKIATGKIATGKIATGKIATGKIATGKIATGKISLNTIGFSSLATLATGKIATGKIATGKIPLISQGGWLAFVSCYPAIANIPVSSLTLAQVFAQPANAQCAAPGDRLSLGDIDLRNSLIAESSWAALLMGRTRLSQYSGIDWCQQLAPFESPVSCTGDGLSRTLFGLNLLDEVPMDSMEALALPLGSITTDALSVPGSSPWAEAAWPQVLLGQVNIPGTRIGRIPLSSLPNISAVLDCTKTSCTNLAGRQLGDADVVAAIRPDAVFADLGSALNPIKVGALVEPFLDRGSFPWEQLPRTLIPLQAYPNRLTLVADVDVNCLQVSNTRFRYQLPAGYDYVPGTATIAKTRGAAGTVSLADPADTKAATLEFAVPDSAFGSSGYLDCTNDSAHLTVKLGVVPPDVDTRPVDLRATGSVVTGSLTASGTQLSEIHTTGLYDPPGTDPNGPRGFADELILGTISARDQIAYVPFDVPAGKNVEVTLSQLTGDLDLVLYHPVGATPDPILAGDAVPVPWNESVLSDGKPGDPVDTANGGATQDVPIRGDRLVAAVSALRGLDDEQLSTVSRPGTTSTYLAQVSGFNGATGQYTLRIRVTDADSLGACTLTPPALPAASTSAYLKPAGGDGATGFRSTDDTVVLVNSARLKQYFPADAQAVLDAAVAFTHAANGVKGQVLQVDADPTVYQRMKDQDAVATNPGAPCDPDLANAVGKATVAFEMSQLPASVKNVVLLGGQELFTHLFPVDTTRDGNEREEAADLALAGNNLLSNAFARGRYAIDTPYAVRTPLIVAGQVVYVPQLSIGRVGETPAQMIAQLTNYVSNQGVADGGSPRSLLATDYDFLTDGTTKAFDYLKGGFASTNHDLTGGKNATWNKADLDARWLNNPNGAPSMALLNMHYDQYRALPAFITATNGEPDLYTSAQVKASATSLSKRVILTVGCHSATDVPDRWAEYAGDPRVGDFAQEYAGKGVAGMVGNLGFGYADTNVIAFSPRQQALMAKNIAAGFSLGDSLAQAQRDYVRSMISISPYDLKAMQEMVLWGVPNYRTTAGGTAQAQSLSASAVPAQTTDPSTGLPTRRIDLGPLDFRTVTDSGGTSHLEARQSASDEYGVAAVSGHPLLPRVVTTIPDADDPSMTVRGVAPVAITSTADERGVRSTFARAGTDVGVPQEPTDEGTYPAQSWEPWVIPGVSPEASLVVTPGHVHMRSTLDGGGAAPDGYSDRYRDTSLSFQVIYGPRGQAVLRDAFRQVDAVLIPAANGNPAVTSYNVRVTPAAGTQTVEVYVLSRPVGGAGAWKMTPLSQIGDSWVGGVAEERGAFYVIAKNNLGFVATTTLSGAGWLPHVVTNVGSLDGISISPNAGATGWRTSTTTATCQPGWTLYVDGAPVGCPYTFTDGPHVVTATTPDGNFVMVGNEKAFVTVLVDTVQPTLSLGFPGAAPPFAADGDRLHLELRGSQPVTETVTCGPSGCNLTDNGVALGSGRGMSTSSVGAQTFTASVTNGAGVSATASKAYRVVFGAGSRFTNSGTGVVVLPILPVKFVYRATDASGATAGPGFGAGTTSAFTTSTSCASGGSFTLPSGLLASSAPTYNAGTGTYEWDLSATALLGCQQLDIALPDGWTHLYQQVQVGPF